MVDYKWLQRAKDWYYLDAVDVSNIFGISVEQARNVIKKMKTGEKQYGRWNAQAWEIRKVFKMEGEK